MKFSIAHWASLDVANERCYGIYRKIRGGKVSRDILGAVACIIEMNGSRTTEPSLETSESETNFREMITVELVPNNHLLVSGFWLRFSFQIWPTFRASEICWWSESPTKMLSISQSFEWDNGVPWDRFSWRARLRFKRKQSSKTECSVGGGRSWKWQTYSHPKCPMTMGSLQGKDEYFCNKCKFSPIFSLII